MLEIPIKLRQIADHIGGKLCGSDVDIRGLSPLDAPVEGTLTLCFSNKDRGRLLHSSVAAALVPPALEDVDLPRIIHKEPRKVFISLLSLFDELMKKKNSTSGSMPPPRLGNNVHLSPGAIVERNVVIGDGSRIGAGAILEEGVRIGRRCRIEPRAVLHRGSRLEDDVVIGAGSVIGAEGFGFQWDGHSHRPIPQLGGVVIEADVRIGAGVTIARGTIGDTRIGHGSRLDCQVHIAHNVIIGPNCVLAAQTGVAGSARLEGQVVLGGQVGVADHAEIGEGVQAAAQTGIRGKVGAGLKIAGTPQMPLETWRRVVLSLPRLPAWIRESKRRMGSDEE